jgi:HEAT repeat protein
MTGMTQPDLTVAQAVEDALRAATDGDEDRRWNLVSHLHGHGGREALEIAARLRHHPERSYRALAADVLSQLGAVAGRSAMDGPFHDDALVLLLTMMDHEHDPSVLHAIAVGFAHIGDERCVEPLLRVREHPDVQVREGVVFGLLGRPERAALEALTALSADIDPYVREWATFGLARQTDEDFPQLRDALAGRLADDDADTLAEAIHGLAVRGDARAVGPLLRFLASPPPINDPNVIVEALYALAAATADLRLYPHLVADRDTWTRDAPDESLPPELQAALARYTTTGHR